MIIYWKSVITEGSSEVIPVSLDAGACYTCIKEKKREKLFNEDKKKTE